MERYDALDNLDKQTRLSILRSLDLGDPAGEQDRFLEECQLRSLDTLIVLKTAGFWSILEQLSGKVNIFFKVSQNIKNYWHDIRIIKYFTLIPIS